MPTQKELCHIMLTCPGYRYTFVSVLEIPKGSKLNDNNQLKLLFMTPKHLKRSLQNEFVQLCFKSTIYEFEIKIHSFP